MTTDTRLMTAILALDAYSEGPGAAVKLPGANTDGVARAVGVVSAIGSAQVIATGVESGLSFFAVAYQWDGKTIISYRGTDEIVPSLTSTGDVLSGWVTGAGIIGGQAVDAKNFYEQVTNGSIWGCNNPNVILTGHSLGGGLAGLIGSITGDVAYAFDSMPYGAAAQEADDGEN